MTRRSSGCMINIVASPHLDRTLIIYVKQFGSASFSTKTKICQLASQFLYEAKAAFVAKSAKLQPEFTTIATIWIVTERAAGLIL